MVFYFGETLITLKELFKLQTKAIRLIFQALQVANIS